jgi:hypothetical protein
MIINDPDFDNSGVYYTSHFGNCYCQTNVNNSCMYVPIPKNASQFTRSKLNQLGFTKSNYHRNPQHTGPILVALREPLDRWITGAVEYLYQKYSDPLQSVINHEEQFLYDQFGVDEHTVRQIQFLQGLDTDNITFICIDGNYEKNLIHFCEHTLGISRNSIDFTRLKWQWQWRNKSVDSSVKIALKKLVVEKINKNYQHLLLKYLQPDYQVFKSVNFYNPT